MLFKNLIMTITMQWTNYLKQFNYLTHFAKQSMISISYAQNFCLFELSVTVNPDNYDVNKFYLSNAVLQMSTECRSSNTKSSI